MSTQYFKSFGKVRYNFGDEVSGSITTDITQYVDIVDHLKANTAFYQDFTIPSGERPDTLSFKLYGTTEYYWTFFLLNDDIRESGWPIANEDVALNAARSYPHRMITSSDDLATEPYDFKVGALIQGAESGTIGTIIKRNLSMGQLVVDTVSASYTVSRDYDADVNENGITVLTLTQPNEKFTDLSLWALLKDGIKVEGTAYSLVFNSYSTEATISGLAYSETAVWSVEAKVKVSNVTDGSFNDGEQFSYFDPTTGHNVSRNILHERSQHLAPHHYEDVDGNWIDVDPFTQTLPLAAGITTITYQQRLQQANDSLKQIKVFKKDVVASISKEFHLEMGT